MLIISPNAQQNNTQFNHVTNHMSSVNSSKKLPMVWRIIIRARVNVDTCMHTYIRVHE